MSAAQPCSNVYRPAQGGEPKSALTDPVITAIAERHGKTPAQVVLRWHIEADARPFPRSR